MKNKPKFTHKKKLAVALMLVSTSALAWCPPHLYRHLRVLPHFESAKATLNGLITTWDATLQAQMASDNERLLSAIHVFTKQKALSTQDNNTAIKNNMQSVATAMNVMQTANQVKDAAYTYGAQFGQGYDPCGTLTTRQIIVGANAVAQEEASARAVTEVHAGSGKVGDPAQVQNNMIADHQQNYCTAEQAKSGLCASAGPMAGKNLSFAVFNEEAKDGDDTYKAKNSFINNLVGLPTNAIPKEIGGTPAGQAAQLASMEKDAVYSIPVTILKEIQMSKTPSGDHVNAGISTMGLLEREVGKYAGNNTNYENWTKVMAAQNEHGVLIELLKVKSLNLALLSKQYRQQELMEAGLASLVASTAKQNQVQKAKDSQQNASSTNISGAIK